MRLLLCDDDPDQLQLLNRYVRRLGHTTVLAANGSDAWAHLNAGEFDVVITDWLMPRPDGLELCRRIRKKQFEPYTYIILLTALGDSCDLARTMRAGADDYIRKPLRSEELEARLIAAERVCSVYAKLARRQQELVLLNRQVREQARTDPLTQLSNRLRLQEDLVALSCRAERYGMSHSILLADIDYFKGYNDRYGHPKGDKVLRRVADTIGAQMRASDMLYRCGGEEFLAISCSQDASGALRGAQRVQEAVTNLAIEHLGSPFGIVTISIGVAAHQPSACPEETICKADEALYRAKQAGRNQTASSPGPPTPSTTGQPTQQRVAIHKAPAPDGAQPYTADRYVNNGQ
ncbi:MAG: diguanylate cyclase [Kofleriaceae bacterium]|nr:diguanylate cyclase [Kofleriaceae bacterium]